MSAGRRIGSDMGIAGGPPSSVPTLGRPRDAEPGRQEGAPHSRHLSGTTDGTAVASRATVVLARLDAWGRFVCIALGLTLGLLYAATGVHNDDAGLFWDTGHSAHYYQAGWESASVYVYPPPLAQLTGAVPWAVFIVPWMLLVFGCFWYALRWLSIPVIVVGALWYASGREGLPWAPLAIAWIGNPQAIIAAAIVAGFRHPAAWAFVLLTKIGPGVGLVWFAVRREWRSLGIVAVVTLAVAAGSFVLAPTTWFEFVGFARANAGTPPPINHVAVPLVVRVAMSLVLVAWGAATDRRWTVPIAAAWSSLALYEWSYILIWLSAIPLAWDAKRPPASVEGHTDRGLWEKAWLPGG